MKIAILGWGSLIWDKRSLRIAGEWQLGGPVLPIEFSRISRDGRLTLVIDEPNGDAVTTSHARSGYENLDDAIGNLQEREDNPPNERIGFVDLVCHTERAWARRSHPSACDRIVAWAQANKWQAVVWTALVSNFAEKRHEPYSVPAAIRYLNGLPVQARENAFKYIQNAPPQVVTPLRREFIRLHLQRI